MKVVNDMVEWLIQSGALAVLVFFLWGYAKPLLTAKAKTAKTEQSRQLWTLAEQVAKTGVVLAEQAGVTNYLTSEAKKSKAVAYVIAELKKLGFTMADETTIASVVEKQFAESKQEIETAYPQKAPQQVAQEQADVEAQKKDAELKQTQADLTATQDKVTSLM